MLMLGLAGIALSLSIGQLPFAVGVIALPLLFLIAVQSVRHPVSLFFMIFTVNYYLLAVTRYIQIDGISFVMDTLTAILFILIIIHSALSRNIEWKYAINTFTIGMFVWLLYCLAEIANPTGLPEAWLLSRSLILNGFFISLIISLVITKGSQVKRIILLLSIFSLTAALKAFVQKYIGFDYAELQWLNNGGALTHIIAYGTRYFSFFTDAGNFGSNMGCASLLFSLIAISVSKIGMKIYYFLVAFVCLLAMFMSGTRGALIVPIAGLMLYTLMSKNIKACIMGGLSLVFIYVFFAFTMIGQSNVMIRRMRTAFNPSEDASFNVRKENKQRLATYINTRPFGEGLGLSGVENQRISMRFTTSIPHDSYYVKIWVETGIVGAILFFGVYFISIFRAAWIVMFKVKDKELRGLLTAFLCGIFGLLISAYGNAFLGQFPTYIITITGITLALKGEYFDKEINETNKLIIDNDKKTPDTLS